MVNATKFSLLLRPLRDLCALCVRLFGYGLSILQVLGIAACSALISRTTRNP